MESKTDKLICHDCHKEIDINDAIKVTRMDDGKKVDAYICKECDEKGKQLDQEHSKIINRQKHAKKSIKDYIASRPHKSALIAAIIVGILIFGLTLTLGLIFGKDALWNSAGWIGIAFALGFTLFCLIYCVFTSLSMAEIFVEIFASAIHIPIIGFIFSIITFIVAVVVCSVMSIFAFPVILTRNIKESKGK